MNSELENTQEVFLRRKYKMSTSEQELIIFTGNIGCGKSLIASKLGKRGYVIVNNDTITSMIQGGEYGLYDKLKKPIYKVIETSLIVGSLKLGFSVVIDRTNMSVANRERYIRIGQLHGVCIKSFCWGRGTSEDLIRRLNNSRGVPVETWVKVYGTMERNYSKPQLQEGFNAIITMSQKFKFYAFDFDGTIVKNDFPGIGSLRSSIVNRMNAIWGNLNNIIIIWTCRSENYLNQMRKFLLDNNVPFDFINSNPMMRGNSPKVFAHKYFDDRNVFMDD